MTASAICFADETAARKRRAFRRLRERRGCRKERQAFPPLAPQGPEARTLHTRMAETDSDCKSNEVAEFAVRQVAKNSDAADGLWLSRPIPAHCARREPVSSRDVDHESGSTRPAGPAAFFFGFSPPTLVMYGPSRLNRSRSVASASSSGVREEGVVRSRCRQPGSARLERRKCVHHRGRP